MMARFEKGNSVLHRLNPVTKLWALSVFSISIFLFESVAVELVCLAAIVLMALAVPSKSTLALLKSKFALALVGWLFIMQVLFTPAGDLLFSVPLYFASVSVTGLGVMKGLLIVLRFLTIIAASMVFVSTTEPAELAYALMKAGLPYRYGFMLITALRFMPIFELEMSTVATAQMARGLDIDRGGMRSLLKSIGYTFVPLIGSALTKVDALVISMDGRAFGYRRTRTFTRDSRFTRLDKVIIVLSSLILALLAAASLLGLVPLPRLMA